MRWHYGGHAMQIAFHASPRPTLGVEVELGIVDRHTRALVSAASELLADIAAAPAASPGGQHPKVKHELFECTVEVVTGICSTVGEARADLQGTIDLLQAATAARGLALIGAGTHPFSHWHEQQITDDPRYHALVARIGWPARRLAIHGVHVHVGVRSGERAVAIAGSLAYHLPVLLALSASSPYWHGLDTEMASCRTKVFEGLPTAGLPPRLSSWSDFEAFMAGLITAGAIETVREVWWDVRPHPDFGTVELRMCDAVSNLGEVATLAALAQCLVHHLDERLDAGEALPSASEWVLRENKWLASRHGVAAGILVDDAGTVRPLVDVLDDLLGDLAPSARALGCERELADARHILEVGPGERRQRRIVAAGGTLADVVDHLIAELDAGEALP